MSPRLWSFKLEIQQISDNWPQTSSGKKIFHFWQFYLGGWPNRFGKILKVILARRYLWSMVLILSKISSLSLFNFDCINEISRKKQSLHTLNTRNIFIFGAGRRCLNQDGTLYFAYNVKQQLQWRFEKPFLRLLVILHE